MSQPTQSPNPVLKRARSGRRDPALAASPASCADFRRRFPSGSAAGERRLRIVRLSPARWVAPVAAAGNGGSARPAEIADPVEAAKVFIEEHLGEPINVTRIAREVELTRPGFTRVFRERTGTSPWAWVLDRRVERAARLLERQVPPSEVADALGFCDQSHLTRVFKRLTGATPGEYQRERTKVQDETSPAP